ncbi:Nucleosomal histone H3-Lys79 methylase [Orbilia oligospora]|uniref:Histone-lysine N-methyltransferase, H3 lysine-79 specific n=1 Tax=Orbilia oligospora TaxID=2813651 RepID=A0A6G1M6P5_ORBOL|nr:Nucleosomal histone H3-Lys79 methylase [Orbilia oligospora]KAF3201763.1 Nucleosomal histone H3-Lys79 methylase [Orbilia oligospora]KAF3215623.1 Nucleosomal histone H3-Lys79 methylase [Orbilia oligospora]KAF3220111.1 Nucleosomal histone H3-Lys79 methylase [Orbilia oligospora]KAF3247652.1 Nucleosomal histone H3-Lys79 methylase [Orbilia oligospora]
MSFFNQFHKKGTNITKVSETIKVTRTIVPASKTAKPSPPPPREPRYVSSNGSATNLTNNSQPSRKRKLQSSRADTPNSSGSGSSSVYFSTDVRSSSSTPIKKQKSRTTLAKHTPELENRLSSSEDESDNNSEMSDLRRKSRASRSLESDVTIYSGEKRNMVNPDSFTDRPLRIVDARSIANLSTGGYKLYFPQDPGLPTDVSVHHVGSPLTEKYSLVIPDDLDEFRPIDDISSTVETVAKCLMTNDQAEAILNEENGILRRLNRFKNTKKQRDYMCVLKEYNVLVRDMRKNGTMKQNIENLEVLPSTLVDYILTQCYQRVVSKEAKLVKEDEKAFTDNVYGELLGPLLRQMFQKAGLRPSSVFVDLGSGVGNAVLHTALEYGCESWGVEMMARAAKVAENQAKEFKYRTRLWGINTGSVTLKHASFFNCDEIDAAMKRADVLLVNNFAFQAKTNDQLVLKFLDLKDGAKIISLKPFVEAGRVINDRNCGDPLNNFRSETFEAFGGGNVSWTDSSLKWYLTTVDREPVRSYWKQAERPRRR